ncbi:MAG: hypothetical protein P8L31_08415 [Pseudomonadales bacterium]|nr:hypothetical protein [Pseudomonadales bacterium]
MRENAKRRSLTAQAEDLASDRCHETQVAKIVAEDGTNLGRLDEIYNSDCRCNEYRDYGITYSNSSLWDQYFDYGDSYPGNSAFNE